MNHFIFDHPEGCYPLSYAGVDEVGRGCLAGIVTVCALVLKNDSLNNVLQDSKKISAKKRQELYPIILKNSDYQITNIDVQEIDRINIFQATMLGMKQSLEALNPPAAFIDGNKIPDTHIPSKAIIGGDGLVPQISAASILAKVHRDHYMIKLAEKYPEYGFEKHKGYGTKQHLEALEKYGVTPHHRKSFKPVQNALEKVF